MQLVVIFPVCQIILHNTETTKQTDKPRKHRSCMQTNTTCLSEECTFCRENMTCKMKKESTCHKTHHLQQQYVTNRLWPSTVEPAAALVCNKKRKVAEATGHSFMIHLDTRGGCAH